MKNIKLRKSKGINEFVVSGILVVIAILIGLIFKEKISEFMTNFFASITSLSNNSFFK